jgi:pyridoxine/pyridoxamine 5'-phosphate oxidase
MVPLRRSGKSPEVAMQSALYDHGITRSVWEREADVPVEFNFEVEMDMRLKEEILSILKGASEMTIATVRPDGYPQATTVNFVSDDLVIYFGCAADSQKARNIACNGKVSLTVTVPSFN